MFFLALIGVAFLAFTSARCRREKNDLFADVFLLLAFFCPFQMSSYLWGSWSSLGAVPLVFFFVAFYFGFNIREFHFKDENILFYLFIELFLIYGTRLSLFNYVYSFISIIPFLGCGFDYDFLGRTFESIGIQTVVENPWFFLFLEFGWIGMVLLICYSFVVLKKCIAEKI